MVAIGLGSGDFKARFSKTTESLDLAVLTFSTPVFGSAQFSGDRLFRPSQPNIVFVNSGDRRTVGRFAGEETRAGLGNATLTVNARPLAEAGANQSVGTPPVTVSFDGTASFDPDGAFGDARDLQFSWSFGDGGSGVGPSPSHQYGTSGLKTVTLTVTDADGATAIDTLTVTVAQPAAAGPPPPANAAPNADAGSPQTVNEGQTVTLQGSGSDPDGDTPTFSWSGDVGLSGAGTATPTFVAPDNGTFTVTLTVTDDGTPHLVTPPQSP